MTGRHLGSFEDGGKRYIVLDHGESLEITRDQDGGRGYRLASVVDLASTDPTLIVESDRVLSPSRRTSVLASALALLKLAS